MKETKKAGMAWRRALLASATIAVMYLLVLMAGTGLNKFVGAHIVYTDGSALRFPAVAYAATVLSIVLSLLATWKKIFPRGEAWYAEVGPALAIIAVAFGLYGPHCEVDTLVLVAGLCTTWAMCKPSLKRVAVLVLVVALVAEFAPSPFGTPGIRLVF